MKIVFKKDTRIKSFGMLYTFRESILTTLSGIILYTVKIDARFGKYALDKEDLGIC